MRRVRLKDARVLLLGAGGAARALAFGLIGEGADLHVFDRTPGRAGELTHALGGTPVGPDDLPGLCPDILVNATSAGMEDPEQLPLPSAAIAGRLVFDLVYGRRRTRLLHEAEARGIECMDGREMLLEQALLQFGLWTGLRGEALDLPRSAMAAAMPEGGRY